MSEEVASSSLWPFGCKGNAADVLVTKGETSPLISQLLERAEVAAGEFSFGGEASLLPAIPGLFIDGIGAMPVPLTEERNNKLLARCEKVSSSTWKLPADQVQMKNPDWVKGIEKLGEKTGDRMGFKRIKLQCELKELMMYGPGEKVNKHQETKGDGVVATLEVQLPSEHSGGVLVVYRGRDLQFRHDFGTEREMAAFLPHYAAYFADAPHAREEVTGGFRLVLKYALSLPPEMKHLEDAKGDKPLSEELAEVLKQVEPEDECFALLLESDYNEKDIQSRGAEALNEMDKTRYRVLLEANSLIPEENGFVFFIARLSQAVKQYDGCFCAHKNPNWKEEYAEWQPCSRKDFVTWYSIEGKKYGEAIRTMYVNEIEGPTEKEAAPPTFMPTLLNPGRLTLSQLWEPKRHVIEGGYGEDWMKVTNVSRYAVFAWPSTKSLEYTFKLANKEASAAVIQKQTSVDSSTLREFIERTSAESTDRQQYRSSLRRYSSSQSKTDALPFCRIMVDLIIKTGDPALVGLLFEKFFHRVKDKKQFAASIVSLIKTFEWKDVKDAVLKAVTPTSDEYSHRWVADMGMALIICIAESLGPSEVRTALLEHAVNRAIKIPVEKLMVSGLQKPLWKLVIDNNDMTMLTNLVEHYKQIKASDLDPVIDAFSEFVVGLDTNDKRFILLASIAEPKMQWLNEQIGKLEKPFTWEMPDALFIDNARVQAFLRGPEHTMATTGLVYFRDLNHARRWTRHSQEKASFELRAEGTGRNAYVTITKTRRHYEEQQKLLEGFKAKKEKLLAKRFGDRGNSGVVGKKRLREDDEGENDSMK
ncbi:hypothetical protein PHMEG_00016696 [Phytophthora megakarya]|uniref:Fe2OG dioxygenase domain-containing protein n=1 Tax=Phytophthora megakarya TaxID=4795 RepID=A0A225VYM2_9STRA|nr:hypothetical protein PHMEG_00016696 [Phytophthora megakarya]